MNLFTESFSKKLVLSGLFLFVIGIILFMWKENLWNVYEKVNGEKISQFSDSVGGIVGSLWALAGVILFYVALTEQRKDIEINRDVLKTQGEALKQQIIEFKAQVDEMKYTREVFTEQSKTLKKQQFESTFFNSVNLLNNIIENVTCSTSGTHGKTYYGRKSFEVMYNDKLQWEYHNFKAEYVNNDLHSEYYLDEKYNIPISAYEKLVKNSYEKFYADYQSNLGHYFRTIYNVVKFIDDSELEKKKYYTNLIRAQLSTYEHLLLFYNCLSEYGNKKFFPLIVKYSLLDNMPAEKLLDKEHEEFYPEEAYQ